MVCLCSDNSKFLQRILVPPLDFKSNAKRWLLALKGHGDSKLLGILLCFLNLSTFSYGSRIQGKGIHISFYPFLFSPQTFTAIAQEIETWAQMYINKINKINMLAAATSKGVEQNHPKQVYLEVPVLLPSVGAKHRTYFPSNGSIDSTSSKHHRTLRRPWSELIYLWN